MTTHHFPGLTHCRCEPPRYIRKISGAWERIWFARGRETSAPVGPKEPPCRCGVNVASEKPRRAAHTTPPEDSHASH